ncbi:MAG: hypothetical protein D6754_16560 [Alphaproteobacteria bacterium]|nr:MAG: hypothetical protein D6754_16560 [Alphaproteobacteria bacterium]
MTADFLPDVSPAGDLARVGAMLDLLFFVVDWSPMGELGVDRVRELYADAKMALARLEAREEHIT